jgi:hypothetical protein
LRPKRRTRRTRHTRRIHSHQLHHPSAFFAACFTLERLLTSLCSIKSQPAAAASIATTTEVRDVCTSGVNIACMRTAHMQISVS